MPKAESVLSNVALVLTCHLPVRNQAQMGTGHHGGPPLRLRLVEAPFLDRSPTGSCVGGGWARDLHGLCGLSLAPARHPGLLLAVWHPVLLEEPSSLHTQSMQFEGGIPILASAIRMRPRNLVKVQKWKLWSLGGSGGAQLSVFFIVFF